MERVKYILKNGFGIALAVALAAWASALIYGIYTDPGNALRYGLKLLMIAGISVWYFDTKDPDESASEE